MEGKGGTSRRLGAIAILATLAACSLDPSPATQPHARAAMESVTLPGGEGGVGLDDLRYARALQRVLVPAGRTGRLDLVDPVTGTVESIHGFAEAAAGRSGHGEGTTSADEGAGLVFAIDRTRLSLDVIDPGTRTIVASAPLAGGPDYVRFVASARELWVTEPDAEQIEVFRLPEGAAPMPERSGLVPVVGGPESLVIDDRRARAYSHLWKGGSVAIALAGAAHAALTDATRIRSVAAVLPAGPAPIVTDRPVWLSSTTGRAAVALPDEPLSALEQLVDRFNAGAVVLTEPRGAFPAALRAPDAAACFTELFLPGMPSDSAVFTVNEACQ